MGKKNQDRLKAYIVNNPRVVEADESGRFFALADPLVALCCVAGKWRKITVPAGFITDFASIPPWAWIVATKLGPWNRPAILHDYLYFSAIFDRKTADLLFLAAMRDRRVVRWRRKLMYIAVRIGGWPSWKRYRR